MDAVTNVPVPANEPIKGYAPGSQERAALEQKIKELAGERAELTMTIGGQQRMGGGDRVDVVQPHNHRHVLGQLADATDEDVAAAIEAARLAAPGWRELSFDDRAAIFLKAADLLAGPWRQTVNAATVLGQSKSPYQAEIDAACELIDFWRYNVHYARRLLAEQPASSPGSWNQLEYRPLEGFVLAITPFNFTSIAGNLPTAPALLGNVVVWKPSPTQQLAAHQLMRAAGGGRPAARRDQPGHRVWPGRLPGRADPSRPGWHPLHRLHRDVPAPVADRGRKHRPLPRLPAAGRRDRRQGLRDRAPVGRPGRAHHRAGPRRVRVSGPEVLGGLEGLHPAQCLEPDAGRPHRRHRGADHG